MNPFPEFQPDVWVRALKDANDTLPFWIIRAMVGAGLARWAWPPFARGLAEIIRALRK